MMRTGTSPVHTFLTSVAVHVNSQRTRTQKPNRAKITHVFLCLGRDFCLLLK